MLHYNFPPYSVGEAGRMGGPGRREIGHGKLAWRARASRCCRPRKTSPTPSASSRRSPRSNGSSSMATVCGASLALMDAGVPLHAPGGRHRHGPDQGRRPASPCCPTSWATRIIWATWTSRWPAPSNGVTALQMDIKITSITEEIMKIALGQARDGRLHILGEMAKAHRPCARDQVSQQRAAHHHDHDPEGQDPRSHRHRRQGDPRDLREHRRQDRHRGRRHDQGRRRRRRRRASAPSTGSAASSPSRRSA